MYVTLLDLATKTRRTIPEQDYPVFWWTQGNGSCDCNRAIFMGVSGPDHGTCDGATRFLVVDVHGDLEEHSKEDILAEINAEYGGQAMMQAGRELDAMVAEKVMGWHRRKDFWATTEEWDQRVADGSWSPSTDWGAAGMVINKLREQYVVQIYIGREVQVDIRTKDDDTYLYGTAADTGPLAIALAAKKLTDSQSSLPGRSASRFFGRYTEH